MQDYIAMRSSLIAAALMSACLFYAPRRGASPAWAVAAELPASTAAPSPPASPKQPPPPPSASNPNPVPDEVAIVATKDALVRFSVKDKKPLELSHEQAAWCAVDNHAQVLWYLTREEPASPPRGSESRFVFLSLKLIDLKENGAPVAVVPRAKVRTSMPTLVPSIDYGRLGHVGSELAIFEPTIFLRLQMKPNPEITVGLDCEGDASWYCFDMEQLDKPRPPGAPLPMKGGIAETIQDLKQMRLQQVEKLATLMQRAGSRPMWRTNDDRRLPRVKSVPAKNCDADLDGCGLAVPISGTPYWSVMVGSSRGDYAHSSEGFYDPAHKLFFDPRRPGLTSPKPLPGDHVIASMFISGSGRHLLMKGAVISFEKGVLFQAERACGWLGAGWYYMNTHP